MGTPRELLIELIGEEVTDAWFKGQAIKVGNSGTTYTLERKKGYIDAVQKRGYRSDYGRIRARNVDDACASFIIAVHNNQAEWKCGNIDVTLPEIMPPKDLTPKTYIQTHMSFLFTKTIDIFRGIIGLPRYIVTRIYSNDVSSETMFGAILGTFTLSLMLLSVYIHPEGDIETIRFWLYNIPYVFILSVVLVIPKHYMRWRKRWGGES